MAGGYRCVLFDDLCRLCSNAGKNNIKIFSNDDLQKKIAECLPISLNESDKLPKGICVECKDYVDIFFDFRKATQNAQKLLEGCLNTTKLRNGGQVYIKDEAPPKKVLKPIQNPSPTKILPNLNLITSTPTKNQQVKKNVIGSPNQNDLISSIMQAVGIQAGEEAAENNVTVSPVAAASVQQQNLPQYTFTLDNGTLKSGQIQYKIENSGMIAQSPLSLSAANEVLRRQKSAGLIVKKETPQLRLTTAPQISSEDTRNKKPKINFVLQATPQKQPAKVQQQIASPPKTVTFTSPAKAQILNIEKISPVTSQASSSTKQVIVPIMVRSDGSRNTLSTGGSSDQAAAQFLQQALQQLSANQVAVAAAAAENKAQTVSNQPYMLMKLQPNADGQFTLMQSTAPAQVPQQTAAENKTQTVNNQPYMTMKLQPNADGQFTLMHTAASAPVPQQTQHLQISLSAQQLQQLGLQATTTHHQQQTITVQPTQLQMPSQIAQPQQQQQQQPPPPQQTRAITPEIQQITSLATVNDDDEIYNDSYDEEYYPDDNENDNESDNNDESHEKSETEKKHHATPKKKAQKSMKSSKTKSSDIYEEPVINPEHSEQAKKQLQLLTSYNAKIKSEEDHKNEINLTVCDVCKKVFKRKEFLMQHLKSHIGIRPFKCSDAGCNKSFSRKEHLLRHESSHTGKKEYQCNVCQKMFSRKDNLNKHRRIHPEAGQPNIRHCCNTCNKGFCHKAQLQKHLPICEGKTSETTEQAKIVKTSQPGAKKPKIKEEKKEETKIIQQQSQQGTKLVQVLQPSSQQPQLTSIKAENQQPQQIYFTLGNQQNKPGAIYALPSNMSNFQIITGSDLANMKFDAQ